MEEDQPAIAQLTTREVEVLELVRRRLTNGEIAAQLFVSVRTVETHVSSVLRKLGASDRRQLATIAERHAPAPDRQTAGGRDAVHLPALRADLVGRSDLVALVSRQLQQARFTTLTGAGGVGKTSVALAVAHGEARHWPEGAVFVDLVPARTPSDVLRALADSLGVEGDASRSASDLAAHLADRAVLIVLDNCEHVIAAAAALVDAALARPGSWRMLATSREPLGLLEEHVVPVEPLGRAATQLFVERARRLEPRVDWDAADPRITDLCERLDGLPLAVELAAGQVRRWSLDELSRRLGDAVLQRPARAGSGSARHQTMSAAVDWSYALLDDAERRLLRHLGVFPSRFDLDALDALRPLLPDDDLTAIIASLVDKSLVVRDPGASSYRLLETIRAFAIDRMTQANEHEEAFERHRRWIVDLARATTELDRWTSGRLAARRHAEVEHVRQAFWASLATGAPEDAAQLALTRTFHWRNAVGCAEGHHWISALEGVALDETTAAWVAIMRSDIAQGDGDFIAMIGAAQVAATHAAGLDPTADALAQHFLMLQHLLDPATADRAIASVLEVSPDERLSNLLRAFAIVAHAGRTPRDALARQVADLEARCTDDGYERFILNWAMWLHGLALRDPQWAGRGIDQQYDYLREAGLGETWLTSFSLAVTAMIDGVSGREQLAGALGIAQREGYRIEGDCMLALAYSEACRGDASAAAELLGAARRYRFNATAHHVLHGVVVDPIVRAAIDADDYAESVARGKVRSADDVLHAYGIRTRVGSRPA